MNIAGTDPNTGGALSVLPPGGTSSCRLGNDLCKSCFDSARTAASLDYQITVTASNTIFTYQYAVVLQDSFGTAPMDASKFTINIMNSTCTQIGGACGTYTVVAQNSLPGYNKCLPAATVCSPQDTVLWKGWTTASIDLSPYIESVVTIQFTAFDSDLGKDFGYAYISCNCGDNQLTQQCSGDSVILTAPAGYTSYKWSPGGDTTQSIVVDHPVNGTEYTCILTPATGTACDVTLQAVVSCSSAIEAITGRDNINISPNPVVNSLYIEAPQSAVIEITNIQGQMIKSIAAIGIKTNIDVTAFPSGVYIVQVKTEKGVEVKKFVKD
jgi:hypothetical protein